MDQNVSRARRWVLALLLAAFTYLVLELISLGALAFLERTASPYRSVMAELRSAQSAEAGSAVARTSDLQWNDYVEVLHPYFGFVADPVRNRPFWNVSELGFVFNGQANPIPKRTPGNLVVAIFGGSFANGVFLSLKQVFTERAAALGKNVQVLNFSSAGYKQPQQLMVLNYLMALGAQFDIVVSVDGFNEVTLPIAENVPSHVNPFYPRSWDRRTAQTVTQATMRTIGYVEYLKQRQRGWADLFLQRRLYFSPTLTLVWAYRHRSMARAISSAEQQLRSGADGNAYTMHGPPTACLPRNSSSATWLTGGGMPRCR